MGRRQIPPPEAQAVLEVNRAPLSRPTRSIEKFPGVRPIEAPDDNRLQERGFEVAQVHAVSGARLRFDRFPVGGDAAGPAPVIRQRAISPYVALRAVRVAMDGDRAELVERPDASRAAA